MTDVNAWAETVTIPTYGIGPPNRNPMFLEKRVYQGSSGVVYPHPVIDRVDDQKSDQEWTAVFLENDYLKIMILPQLGGRVQMALDKTNNYHFIYYNRVIKPALVGLAGPWISGGIEFNWPQHHRPSTYQPVDWAIQVNGDGSKTVWCSEIERMFRTRGRHGFTLHPQRAVLDIDVHLSNRTSEPQTFLWWANPAVHVNDNYQSVFPPDVHAVMDHGKRDVSDFPIATGTYYKQDYAPGTDISRYKNVPVPTSYMAYHSDYNFVGCYDHGVQAGMMHVANHHLVPGKKQWTWGCGSFGQAWDRQLTDEDGPYIELMCGAFTDNQPDFSWLAPGEEKSFTQTFQPYKGIGPAHNANRDAVVSLHVMGPQANLGIYVTSPQNVTMELWRDPSPLATLHNHKNMVVPNVARRLSDTATKLFRETRFLTPAEVWLQTVSLSGDVPAQELTLVVHADGKKLIEYTPLRDERPDVPRPATAAIPPAKINSSDELFINGQHLEQYRHATYLPESYYCEALRRDSGDCRCNNAMGLLLLRRGKFKEAEGHFRAAITRLTTRNPNPYDGEVFFNLGRALKLQQRYVESYDAFYKAVWSEAWKSPAYFELAQLSARREQWEQASSHVRHSLFGNCHNEKAQHLEAVLLRKMGETVAARECVTSALEFDPLNPALRFEAHLLGIERQAEPLEESNAAYHAIEVGLDYLHAGCWTEAEQLFRQSEKDQFLATYFLAWSAERQGETDRARDLFTAASEQPREFAFPNIVECVPVLQRALEVNPADAVAAYALGNFWYSHRQYDDAISCWEQCTQAEPNFATPWRNLGLAYMNKRNDPDAARAALAHAFAVNTTDARVLFELDQSDRVTGQSVTERLNRLEEHRDLVLERDDLAIEYATLLNIYGRSADALHILTHRTFHPWEGGEGKTTAQYVRSLIQLALEAIEEANYEEALVLLERARVYPLNLAEGKLAGARENDVLYFLGHVHAIQGNQATARDYFSQASEGSGELASAMYYNDQPPDMLFYQGMARQRLGDHAAAEDIFRRLVEFGENHWDDEIEMDYFAVSLPEFLVFDEDLTENNRIHCQFMRALGLYGLATLDEESREESRDEAALALSEILAERPHHVGAAFHLMLLESE